MNPGYKHSSFGPIPVAWEERRLGDIAVISSGGTPSRDNPKYWNGAIPWVTTSQINFNEISEAAEHITDAGLKNSAARLLPPGTLLMALYGQGKTRGKVGVLTFEAATNQACASISVGAGVSIDFMRYFLTNRYDAIRNASNGGGQDNLSGQIVRNLSIALPPLREQKAIAAALSDVDALLGALDRLIAKKRDLKQAAMQQLLTGQNRLPGFSERWTDSSLGRHLRAPIRNGYSPVCPAVATGLWILSLSAVTEGGYNATGVKPAPLRDEQVLAKLLLPGDIIVSRSNTPERVGLAGIYSGDPDPCAYPDLMMRVRTLPSLAPEYLLAHLLSNRGRKFFSETARGSSSSMVKIDRSILEGFPLPVPEVPEQRAIAAVLSDMDAEITALEQRRDKTRLLKQGMMQELLTGRTRLV